MNVDRTTDKLYRKSVACLTDDELSREIWVLEEHIKYLHKEDFQSALQFSTLLEIAKDERNRRAYNRGYV